MSEQDIDNLESTEGMVSDGASDLEGAEDVTSVDSPVDFGPGVGLDSVVDSKVSRIVKTGEGAKDGQNKCPKCGSTDIELDVSTDMLRCNFCRVKFELEKVAELDTDLKGEVIGAGAGDIIADVKDILTFKCSSCAAEVVIDTSEAMQARCHWCRNTLSVNQQIPNGAVPDMVLPFKVKKDEAQIEIEKFVEKRKFFANPKFKREFTAENIMGVYLPYMVVDASAHSNLVGQGEREIYTRRVGISHNADSYDVEREFDIVVDDLTVESSTDKLQRTSDKTNSVINAIMPFDTENCVKWNANYLKGYTSERRDINIENLRELVSAQLKDIARHKANETLKEYDRGVKWITEELDVKGQQWKVAYLPVWLYSYQQVKNNRKKLLHYVAVNARTKETMGSVPIHMLKLIGVSVAIVVLGLIAISLFGLFIHFDSDSGLGGAPFLFGLAFFGIMYAGYRNYGVRHVHERETKSTISNVREVDVFVGYKKGLKDAWMIGANNTHVSGYSGNFVKKSDILKRHIPDEVNKLRK